MRRYERASTMLTSNRPVDTGGREARLGRPKWPVLTRQLRVQVQRAVGWTCVLASKQRPEIVDRRPPLSISSLHLRPSSATGPASRRSARRAIVEPPMEREPHPNEFQPCDSRRPVVQSGAELTAAPSGVDRRSAAVAGSDHGRSRQLDRIILQVAPPTQKLCNHTPVPTLLESRCAPFLKGGDHDRSENAAVVRRTRRPRGCAACGRWPATRSYRRRGLQVR